MERLLSALEGLPPAYLVGGAVRDLLRGADPIDLDIAVEGDARTAAREIADRFGHAATEYERFGTADVKTPDATYHFATTREEVYDAPGALPRVSPASLSEDLGRRDFTVNAMAVGLTGDDLGHLYDPLGGVADLHAGVIRVLHERSFLDDPTRLVRAVRYASRLGFDLDPETERLAREAVAAEALSTVSGERIGVELELLLNEAETASRIELLRDLEIHSALHPELDPDPEVVPAAVLGATAIHARGPYRGSRRWSRALRRRSTSGSRTSASPPASATRHRARRAWVRASRWRCATTSTRRPSSTTFWRTSRSRPWRSRWRCGRRRRPCSGGSQTSAASRLEISGADLLAAGVPEGPAIGRALEETLRRKLDGLVSGPDEELETALLLAREPAQ